MLEKGSFIYERRLNFLNKFLPPVLHQYNLIANDNDKLILNYDSQLNNQSFEALLSQNLQRDLYMQQTGCGIHKDDVLIELQQSNFKNIASQGQRKSLLFAFKLAAFEILKK